MISHSALTVIFNSQVNIGTNFLCLKCHAKEEDLPSSIDLLPKYKSGFFANKFGAFSMDSKNTRRRRFFPYVHQSAYRSSDALGIIVLQNTQKHDRLGFAGCTLALYGYHRWINPRYWYVSSVLEPARLTRDLKDSRYYPHGGSVVRRPRDPRNLESCFARTDTIRGDAEPTDRTVFRFDY